MSEVLEIAGYGLMRHPGYFAISISVSVVVGWGFSRIPRPPERLCASAIDRGQLPFRYITTQMGNWLYIYIYNCYSAVLALGMARSRSGDILADDEEGGSVTR